MTEIDPKELKILSDILALVLEDNPGQSDTALQALRNRARKNSTTGGALKNLFQTIAVNPSKAKSTTRQTGTRASASKAKTTDMPDQYPRAAARNGRQHYPAGPQPARCLFPERNT
jgi:hypothetical protein